MRRTAVLLVVLLLVPLGGARSLDVSDVVIMRAAAVAETANGLVGSTATISISTASGGSGHIFLDTFPLTEVDMQGSARLAARVASQITGKPLAAHDFFFVIRSGSTQIGGPSAGGALAVGTIAALNGWAVRNDALMTGTINPDGTIGPVGGVPEKAGAAAQAGMRTFLFPAGQESYVRADDPSIRVNLTAYCRETLSIECIPVSSVYDAVGHLTDHNILRPPITGNVTGEAFDLKLAPLSKELIDQAQKRIDQATADIARVAPERGQDALMTRLARARDTLTRARNASDNGTYYTASSLSFQSAVDAHGAWNSARYLADGQDGLNATFDEAREAVRIAREATDLKRLDDTARIESIGAAQDRVLQAERQLAQAETLVARGGNGLFEGLDAAGFATERADTARWWLRLSESMSPGQPVAPLDVALAARDAITTSNEIVTYVEAVLSSAGVTLSTSREKLKNAEIAIERGYYAGAMILALEAEVRASAILELASFGGTVPESKFETARLEAARAIQAARERGVEPLVAQSAYEFSFAQPDPVERLSFLGMARTAANLAGEPGFFTQAHPAESRFQGLPAPLGIPAPWVAAAFAVGLAMGAGIGLAALMPRKDEEDEDLSDGASELSLGETMRADEGAR